VATLRIAPAATASRSEQRARIRTEQRLDDRGGGQDAEEHRHYRGYGARGVDPDRGRQHARGHEESADGHDEQQAARTELPLTACDAPPPRRRTLVIV